MSGGTETNYIEAECQCDTNPTVYTNLDVSHVKVKENLFFLYRMILINYQSEKVIVGIIIGQCNCIWVIYNLFIFINCIAMTVIYF